MRIRVKVTTKNYELEERRKNLGYSQAELAEIVGMRTSTYQLVEQLKLKPSQEQAIALGLELGVSENVLFPQGYEKIVDVFNKEFDRIADYTPPLLEFDEQKLLQETDAKLVVHKVLKQLPKREKQLLEFRYGIKRKAPKTLGEVGKEFGVTQERIRQMEAKAHERIRYILKKEKYEE